MNVTHEDENKVKQYVKEAIKAEDRAAEEKEHVKDILNTLKSDHDIPPAIARKLITAMRRGTIAEVKEQMDLFSDLAEVCA